MNVWYDLSGHKSKVFDGSWVNSKAKASVPGHQISWVSEWVIEYVIFSIGLFQQWRPRKKKIWHKGSLGGQDDARTSSTCISQRKHMIPHSDENASQHVTSVLVTALGDQPVCFSDGARSFRFGPRWRPAMLLVFMSIKQGEDKMFVCCRVFAGSWLRQTTRYLPSVGNCLQTGTQTVSHS